MTQLVRQLSTLELDSSCADKLSKFSGLFAKWNEKINLSSAANSVEIEVHLRDSLHVIPHLRGASMVIDVGSGGGFPVVVAAICLPDIQFTALEPVHKKHAFLRTAARELQLGNLTAVAQRVEDHEPSEYDVAMSRATFDLAEWIVRGFDLVYVGGKVIGFEAIERDDLPAPFERHIYDLGGKRRAVIVAIRTA
ncbi:MAG: 16S rRNA (guanine(527)-N(7))-methyltransferase RsmG [Deltaproteobacteria bacterium]|nr:16S rRNA (guanine(527)-N(7))-methyltransferase RsmG [Deltaproteobacteria bacterium]MDQ3295026.1 16S rRNA (guanine(527)-N(7))-methyltransferase RsmG [Myxococcota bacterium]